MQATHVNGKTGTVEQTNAGRLSMTYDEPRRVGDHAYRGIIDRAENFAIHDGYHDEWGLHNHTPRPRFASNCVACDNHAIALDPSLA